MAVACRSETVMEPGEFAVRGGLVDLFPPGTTEPVRLDLFGDVLARKIPLKLVRICAAASFVLLGVAVLLWR